MAGLWVTSSSVLECSVDLTRPEGACPTCPRHAGQSELTLNLLDIKGGVYHKLIVNDNTAVLWSPRSYWAEH